MRSYALILALVFGGCASTQQRQMVGWSMVGGGAAASASWLGAAIYTEAKDGDMWGQAGVAIALASSVALAGLIAALTKGDDGAEEVVEGTKKKKPQGSFYWVKQSQCSKGQCVACPQWPTEASCRATPGWCKKIDAPPADCSRFFQLQREKEEAEKSKQKAPASAPRP